MTVSNTKNYIQIPGDGSTTVFPYDFKIPTAGDIEVYILNTTTSTAEGPLDPALFTLSGVGESAGGTVTYPLSGSPLAATDVISIYRKVAHTQETSITPNDGFDADVIEERFDNLVFQIQQVEEAVSRSIRIGEGARATDTAFNVGLPAPIAGKVLVVNDTGTAFALLDLAASGLETISYGKLESGATRPGEVESGSLWLDSSGGVTNNVLTYFDGTNDISLGIRINLSTQETTLLSGGNAVVSTAGSQNISGTKSFLDAPVLEGTGPFISWNETDAGTGLKRYRVRREGGNLRFTTLADNAGQVADDIVITGSTTGASSIVMNIQGGLKFTLNSSGLTVDGDIVSSAGTLGALPGLLHVRDEKSANTGGGATVAGAWTKHDVTATLANTISGASLSSSVITLPAGTYETTFSMVGAGVDMQVRLQDTTGTATILNGIPLRETSDFSNGVARNFCRFVLTEESDLEFQYFADAVDANGLGRAVNLASADEVYLDAVFHKLA